MFQTTNAELIGQGLAEEDLGAKARLGNKLKLCFVCLTGYKVFRTTNAELIGQGLAKVGLGANAPLGNKLKLCFACLTPGERISRVQAIRFTRDVGGKRKAVLWLDGVSMGTLF